MKKPVVLAPKLTREQMARAQRALAEVDALFAESGVDLLDNYAYRELGLLDLMEQIAPSVRRVAGRTGSDFVAIDDGIEDGESKTSIAATAGLTRATGQATFAKQDGQIDRQKALAHDAFALGAFRRFQMRPWLAVFVTSATGVAKVRDLIRAKQEVVIARLNGAPASGRGMDTIVVSFFEIISACSDEEMSICVDGLRISKADYLDLTSPRMTSATSPRRTRSVSKTRVAVTA